MKSYQMIKSPDSLEVSQPPAIPSHDLHTSVPTLLGRQAKVVILFAIVLLELSFVASLSISLLFLFWIEGEFLSSLVILISSFREKDSSCSIMDLGIGLYMLILGLLVGILLNFLSSM